MLLLKGKKYQVENKTKKRNSFFSQYVLVYYIFIETLDEDPRFSSSQFKSFVKGLEMTDDDTKWTSEFVNQSGSNQAQGTTINCECHKGRYLYFNVFRACTYVYG